jgi:hypothetical protein
LFSFISVRSKFETGLIGEGCPRFKNGAVNCLWLKADREIEQCIPEVFISILMMIVGDLKGSLPGTW